MSFIIPAILNVLVGAANVILFCAAISETEANGICLWPNNAISECISSDMTQNMMTGTNIG